MNDGVRRRRGDRTTSVVISLAVHVAVLSLLLAFHARVPPAAEPGPVVVSLVEGLPAPSPQPDPAPPAAQKTPDKPVLRPAQAKPTPVKPTPPKPIPIRAQKVVELASPISAAGADSAPQSMPEVSEARLAGATTAASGGTGAGGSGQSCNMVPLLQAALRKDRRVQTVVAQARPPSGRAMMVWDGDWVQHPGEDGRGLAGLREAMMVEIAFAPVACRAQPMRGLVVISLDDGPGAARIAFGAGTWRWSDLLFNR